MLYNILLIIDFQKQFIVEHTGNGEASRPNFYANECIIEEAENEEETEIDVRNTNKY